MKGGISAPMLAVLSLMVMVTLVTSVIWYTFYLSSSSKTPQVSMARIGLLYNRGRTVYGVLNLIIMGEKNVVARKVTVYGEREKHVAVLGITLEPGEGRVLRFSVPDAYSDFLEGRVYSLKLLTNVGLVSGSCMYIGSPSAGRGKIEWPQFMHDESNSNAYDPRVGVLSDANSAVDASYGLLTWISPPAVAYGYIWLGLVKDSGSYLLRIDPYDIRNRVAVRAPASKDFSPLGGDGLVYTANLTKVAAIEPSTLNIVWEADVEEGAEGLRTGVYYNGKLFVPYKTGEYEGVLYVFSSEDGSVLKKIELDGAPTSHLTLSSGLVYVCLQLEPAISAMVAVDAEDLEIRWSSIEMEGTLYDFSMPVSGGLIFCFTVEDEASRVYVFDAETGYSPVPPWVYDLEVSGRQLVELLNPVVMGSSIYVGGYVRVFPWWLFGRGRATFHYDGGSLSFSFTGVADSDFNVFMVKGLSGASNYLFFTGNESIYPSFRFLYQVTADQWIDSSVSSNEVVRIDIPNGDYHCAPLVFGHKVFTFGLSIYKELIIVEAS